MRPAPKEIYIGLMSGTSLDGVDGVIADFSGPSLKVLQHAYWPFSAALRQELLALNTPGPDEIHRAALAANALVRVYAEVVHALLNESGLRAGQVKAIGAHGQTVRHRPQEFDASGYTCQLNNPALLAELTGMDVVADFRSRDVAAGGQGAPLVPAFHREVFGRAHEAVAVLNLGGIANVTLIPPQSRLTSEPAHAVLGFDCGPANALMDYWAQQHLGQPFDEGGRWAAQGRVLQPLLAALLHDPYFAKVPPKSTGRDTFNVPWLTHRLAGFGPLQAVDVQATLAELTATSCVQSILSYQKESGLLIVCGGGALNAHLMQRLQVLLPGLTVAPSSDYGLPPLQVEAAAFAWLARKAIHRETGNLPQATGAKGGPADEKKGADGARILGAIYPA